MTIGKFFFIGLGVLMALTSFQPSDAGAAEKDGGFVVYPASGSGGPVVFSHKVHGIRTAGFACDPCHGSPAAKAPDVTMDRIRQGKACGACHDGKTKGPRGQSAAAEVQDCPACHMPDVDIVIRLNRMDAVAFSHSRHLKIDRAKQIRTAAGFSCRECHPAPFERTSKGPVGMEVPHESGGCVQCHNGKKRTDGMPAAFSASTRCLTCHKPPA